MKEVYESHSDKLTIIGISTDTQEYMDGWSGKAPASMVEPERLPWD